MGAASNCGAGSRWPGSARAVSRLQPRPYTRRIYLMYFFTPLFALPALLIGLANLEPEWTPFILVLIALAAIQTVVWAVMGLDLPVITRTAYYVIQGALQAFLVQLYLVRILQLPDWTAAALFCPIVLTAIVSALLFSRPRPASRHLGGFSISAAVGAALGGALARAIVGVSGVAGVVILMLFSLFWVGIMTWVAMAPYRNGRKIQATPD